MQNWRSIFGKVYTLYWNCINKKYNCRQCCHCSSSYTEVFHSQSVLMAIFTTVLHPYTLSHSTSILSLSPLSPLSLLHLPSLPFHLSRTMWCVIIQNNAFYRNFKRKLSSSKIWVCWHHRKPQRMPSLGNTP